MKQLVLLDAPLLFESRFLEYITCPIVVVHVTQETQQARLMARNPQTAQQALEKINS